MASFTDLGLSIEESREWFDFVVDVSNLQGNASLDLSTLRIKGEQPGGTVAVPFPEFRFGYPVSNTRIRLYKSSVLYMAQQYGGVPFQLQRYVTGFDTAGDIHRSPELTTPAFPSYPRGLTRQASYPSEKEGYIACFGSFDPFALSHWTTLHKGAPKGAAGSGLGVTSGIRVPLIYTQPFLQRGVSALAGSHSWGIYGKRPTSWKWEVHLSDKWNPLVTTASGNYDLDIDLNNWFYKVATVFSDPNISYSAYAPAADGGGIACALVKSGNAVKLVFKRVAAGQEWPADSDWVVVAQNVSDYWPDISFSNFNGSGTITIRSLMWRYSSVAGGGQGTWLSG